MSDKGNDATKALRAMIRNGSRFHYNASDPWYSIIELENGETKTVVQIVEEFAMTMTFLNLFEDTMQSLRERFHDYDYEINGEGNVIDFLDAIRRGATKQRADWKPDENADAEIADWEALRDNSEASDDVSTDT